MAQLLGIDVGTTGVRAAVFEAGGELIADASVPCPFESPQVGWAEIDPRRWWTSLAAVIAELAPRLPGGSLARIAAIAVVGQAPTIVPTDAQGAPLGPAILWLDTRAAAEARELGIHAYYLGPKLRWMMRHTPDVLRHARWLLQSHAWVAFSLTGVAATDPSTAALALPLFEPASRRWRDDAVLESFGVRALQLPPVRGAHEVLGELTSDAARALGGGLRAGVPVVVGGGDFAAATLGAGVLDEGEACLMLGTAGNLLVPRDMPGRDPRLIHAHHVGVDRWLSLGGTLSGGAQEWLRHALTRASSSEETAVRHALPPFDVLDSEAESVPAGSEGVLFLPYLQGERTPIWDTDARGAYVGLGFQHARGHLWRALLEGIALGFADCQDVLAADGVTVRDVVAANGGGKSALFRQILCDALGVPLAYAPDAAGTVAGAAILAGLGCGAIEGAGASRLWRSASIRHQPDQAAHRLYRELLSVRREAYAGLRPVFPKLAR